VGFGPEGDAVAGHGPAAILAHYRDLPDLLDRLVPA
ncbi:MAG: haloacid dehalogenase, partial [Kocuria rhizophila]